VSSRHEYDSINTVRCSYCCWFVAVCNGIVVQNLAAAQRLKGCTIIKGVLEIQILGGCKYTNDACLKSMYYRFCNHHVRAILTFIFQMTLY